MITTLLTTDGVQYAAMPEVKIRLKRLPQMLFDKEAQEQHLYLVLLALIVLNLAAAIITAGSLHDFAQARNDARQWTTTNTDLASVYSGLRDAESGQRGYIITGNSSYLSPYYTGASSAKHYISVLRPEYQNTSNSKEFSQLTQLSQEKLGELAETITLRTNQGFGAAAAVVNTNRGQIYMDQIHSLLTTMEQQVTTRTNNRDHEASAFSVVAYSSLVASFVLTLILVYFVRLVFSQLTAKGQGLESANTELGRSNRELQDFASIASHDLQEPLRKIQAFGDRLGKAADLSDDNELYLSRMLDAASRMRVLIDDLLTYSRVTTKAQPFTRVNLKQIASEVVGDLEVRIEETGAKIKVGKLPIVEADRTQMRQIFQNLISNAIKFHAPDVQPKIDISSTNIAVDDQQMVSIFVADNGIGFDQKYTDRIFTIFQRLHGRNEYEGTGVGLAVVRKIAERHGGNVIAESEIGKGSRFVVTIPVTHKES